MRSLIISLVCLCVLLGMWILFDNYSEKELHSYTATIEKDILPAVEDEEWNTARHSFRKLDKNWHRYKKKACLYLETQNINDVDYSVARAKYYIKAKDVSNATGELACLKEQLKFLHFNENLSLSNIL